ncbi:MAG: hypothetical protein AWU57_347 [Marinobacter sp. T13-3]|nr:MAG: hypothetical protein AWU57_347 [Marinobacter sp. T13-3]
MTQPLQKTPAPPIFVVYDANDAAQIIRITRDADVGDQMRQAGHQVFETDPVIAASQLYLTPSLYETLDDPTWAIVARGMKDLLDRHLVNMEGEREGPFFDNGTPLDLPEEAARLRLFRLAQFPAPANLEAQRELTELLMAYKNTRGVDKGLFTEQSLKMASWEEMLEEDAGDLRSTGSEIQTLHHDIKRANDALAAKGEQAPREDQIEEMRLVHEMTELDMQIDTIERRMILKENEQAANELSEALAEDHPDDQGAPRHLHG